MEEETLTPREAVDLVLNKYGERYGHDFRLDEEGNCALQFGSNMAVAIEVPEDSDLVLVYAPIAPLPYGFEARQDVFQAMLSRNLVQQMLGGGAIALDPDGGILIYVTSRSVEGLDPAALDAMFDTALEAVFDLREEIGFDPEALASEAAAAAAAAGDHETADTFVKV